MCPFKAVNKQKANKVKIRFTDCGFFVGAVVGIPNYFLKQIQTSSNRLSCTEKLTGFGVFVLKIQNFLGQVINLDCIVFIRSKKLDGIRTLNTALRIIILDQYEMKKIRYCVQYCIISPYKYDMPS